MLRLPHSRILVLLAVGFLGTGCANYHRFRPTVVEHAGISARAGNTGDMNDAAVVSYADQTRDILRKRFHIARNVRQTSSTAQVLLAGAAGLAGAFQAGTSTIVALASGSAALPQVGDVFDTGNRANAYQQAVAKISEAEDAYFKLRAGMRPVVPDNTLTIEGALLLEAVNGATDAVELFQAGMLPTLDQLRRAEGLELRRRASLKESRTSSGGGSPVSSGGESPRRTTRPPPPKEDDSMKVAALEARRDSLCRLVDTLPSGTSAKFLNPDAASALDDAIARQRLKELIKSAEDPLLQHLETTVRTAATTPTAAPIAVLPAPKRPPTPPPAPLPIATPLPLATPAPVTPAPAPSLTARRAALNEKIGQFPAGSAARIVQPKAPQRLDDGTAKKLLTEMVNVAEDPLLGALEKKVRDEVLR